MFDFDDTLGRGSYGDVFKGHKKGDPSELVAVKRIALKDLTGGATGVVADTEVQALQQLRHRNIIALYDFQNKNGQLYLTPNIVLG